MNHMFEKCESLKSLKGLSSWKTNKVINISYMFYECTSITNLDNLSEWDVSNVTNMSNMFYMESISSWMGGHFNLDAKCLTEFGEEMKVFSYLENIEGVLNWNTKNVTKMYKMFY